MKLKEIWAKNNVGILLITLLIIADILLCLTPTSRYPFVEKLEEKAKALGEDLRREILPKIFDEYHRDTNSDQGVLHPSLMYYEKGDLGHPISHAL